MDLRTLLAWPLTWLLVRTDALAVAATVFLVALPTAQCLVGLGLGSAAAVLSSLPVALAAGLGVGLWWVSPRPGRRSCHDVALGLADRAADWAGWTILP
ncbi:hypothetical protein [Streptomyces sp. NPDC094049]|uniref:hypothetical protein n=1 Tax=Streptomyces sp. NPDC094049 TaxID=3154987 RepID=UPI0033209629